MIVRKEVDLNAPLSDDQKKMLEDLAIRPVCPDEDCPEIDMSEENLSRLIKRIPNKDDYNRPKSSEIAVAVVKSKIEENN